MINRVFLLLVLLFCYSKYGVLYGADSDISVLAPNNIKFQNNGEIIEKFVRDLTNKQGVIEDKIYKIFKEIYEISTTSHNPLSRIIEMQDIIFNLNDALTKKTEFSYLFENQIFQELLVLATYLNEIKTLTNNNDDLSLDMAFLGCSSPDHLYRIFSYFLMKSGIEDRMFLEKIQESKNKTQVYSLPFSGKIPTDQISALEPGGVIYQVFPPTVALNAKKNERPIEAFKRLIEQKIEDFEITSIWMMPMQFYRGWGDVDSDSGFIESPYGRSANCNDWNILTPEEEIQFVRFCSDKGITVYFDTVLNHTGRDGVLGLTSGPYPEKCYKRTKKGNAIVTFTWEGDNDETYFADTMALTYDRVAEDELLIKGVEPVIINVTYEAAYQEMASRLRRLGWYANSSLKVGFRYDVAGKVGPQKDVWGVANSHFWQWACMRFKEEFGRVPPGLAEWSNQDKVISMFGLDSATYDEKIRKELITISWETEKGYNYFGELPYLFQLCKSAWDKHVYLPWTNHDENTHNPLKTVLAKYGFDLIPYQLGAFSIHNNKISLDKLKVYLAMTFLGFPPNLTPSLFAGDELITKDIDFLKQKNEPLGDLSDAEIAKYTKKLFSRENQSERPLYEIILKFINLGLLPLKITLNDMSTTKNLSILDGFSDNEIKELIKKYQNEKPLLDDFINKVKQTSKFFSQVAKTRKYIFRDTGNYLRKDVHLIKAREHLWIVRHNFFDKKNELSKKNIYIIINKESPFTTELLNSGPSGWHEKEIVVDGDLSTTIKPWQVKVIEERVLFDVNGNNLYREREVIFDTHKRADPFLISKAA